MSRLDSLPSTLRNQLKDTYDGFIAAIYQSASEANNLALALKRHEISHRQKIVKRKRKPNLFVVMVIPDAY